MSPRRRSRPITSLRYAAASSGVNRRSAARISTSSPRARSRASGSAGSARLASTRCSLWGEMVEQERQPVLDVAGVDDVVVVEHQHDVVGESAELVEQRGEHRFDRRRLGACRSASAPPPTPGAAVRSAAIT